MTTRPPVWTLEDSHIIMVKVPKALRALSLASDIHDADLMLARERWKHRHLVAKPAPPAVYWWPNPLGAA